MRTTLPIALGLSLLLVGCDEADWSGTYARADTNGVAGGDTSQFSWTFDGQSRAD